MYIYICKPLYYDTHNEDSTCIDYATTLGYYYANHPWTITLAIRKQMIRRGTCDNVNRA